MSEFVTVDISQGRLRGKRVTSDATGSTFYSFQGIPYAKPPVGPLRFKPPEEADSWTGTRDALQEGACAPQINFFTKTLDGTEDCLFLNVYTPQWPARTPKVVMVWIHGGAFVLGSGDSDMYGPDYLVAEDVVLVTINYRLGALGFLYLEGCDVTGNNGLRDQVMALKWVRDNIAQFGGDPGNVTIFGESAGGASVHLLMLSPLARGLFHRAIAQSGTALLSGCHTTCDVSSRRAVRLAKLLGCSSEDPQAVADYLRTVPAEKIVAQQSECLLEEVGTQPAKLLGCSSEDPQAVADYLRTVPAEKIVAQQSECLLEEVGTQPAKLLGCSSEDPQAVADYLRTVPAEKIVAQQSECLLEEVGTQPAKLLGCSSEDPQAVADYLRTVPAEKIVAQQSECLLEEVGTQPAKLLGCSSEDPQAVADYLRTVPAEKIVAQQSECLLEEVGTQPAKLLGCSSEDPQAVADYLRTVPAEKIVAQQSECLLEEEKARVIPLACVPSDEIGPEAFLPAPVRTLLDEGQFAKVPFITGVTSAEGKVMLIDLFRRVTLSELDQNFEKVLPPEWFQNIGSEKCRQIAELMKKYYFGESHVADETISHYVDMVSDLMFVFPMHQTVRAHVAWSPQPTYVYLFDHVNESRFNFLTNSVDELPGAPHGSELSYFFQSSHMPLSFSPGSPDALVKDTSVKLWTQFAKSGNPSNGTANVHWIPTTEGSPSYLKIKEDFVMETDLYKKRMDFLDDLYKKVLSQAGK
ncbi:pyrethroid hydrolase Ces2a-like [Bacillus rossius redtenbacheri]|uniref:pyrethroid hydrolase Ces2a-like n=1 Tax=Bacillus rossius redtenbacheri TaxID=93214 RepID=UPI002FDE3AEC